MSKLTVAIITLTLLTGALVYAIAAQPTPDATVVPVADVQWTPLNPARGDASPQAANLWGNRAQPGPTGFLVTFIDGFSSPPHIHNVTYRGIVINGLIHNDDPDAEPMWMPAGSYWTQPAGEAHITSASGNTKMAYIEIGDGPYLVRPTDQAFDNGERPVNVHPSNIVWLNAADTTLIDTQHHPTSGLQLAFLWGQPQTDQPSGTLIKIPSNSTANVHTSTLHAVVIEGQTTHNLANAANQPQTLKPGSYFGSTEDTTHELSCGPQTDCIIYLRTQNKLEITPQPSS